MVLAGRPSQSYSQNYPQFSPGTKVVLKRSDNPTHKLWVGRWWYISANILNPPKGLIPIGFSPDSTQVIYVRPEWLESKEVSFSEWKTKEGRRALEKYRHCSESIQQAISRAKPDLPLHVPSLGVIGSSAGNVAVGAIHAGVRTLWGVEWVEGDSKQHEDLSADLADSFYLNMEVKAVDRDPDLFSADDWASLPNTDFLHISATHNPSLAFASAVSKAIELKSPSLVTLDALPEYLFSSAWQVLEANLKAFGYSIATHVVRLEEYGVPVSHRWLIVTCQKDESEFQLFPPNFTSSWWEVLADRQLTPEEGQLRKDQKTELSHYPPGQRYLIERAHSPRIASEELPAFWSESALNVIDTEGNLFALTSSDRALLLGFPEWVDFPEGKAVEVTLRSIPPLVMEQVYRSVIWQADLQKAPVLTATDVQVVEAEQLTPLEQERLKALELQVGRFFFGAWQSLAEIRDKRLYRGSHRTFEDYLRANTNRWGQLSRRHADRQIAAWQIVEALDCPVLPSAESQIRPLTSLSKQNANLAWNKAVKLAGGVPSAKIVAEVAQEFYEQEEAEQKKSEFSQLILEIEIEELPVVTREMNITASETPLEDLRELVEQVSQGEVKASLIEIKFDFLNQREFFPLLKRASHLLVSSGRCLACFGDIKLFSGLKTDLKLRLEL